MADTQRTEAALLAAFPNNNTQEITPQDFRDLVVSSNLKTGGQYVGGGRVFLGSSTATVTTIASLGVPVLVDPTSTTLHSSRNFTKSANSRVRYDGENTEEFMVSAIVSAGSTTATVLNTTILLYKNGAPVTNISSRLVATDTALVGAHEGSLLGITSLAKDDYLEIYIANNTNTDNYDILSYQLVVTGQGV